MNGTCAYCQQPFLENDPVQPLPPIITPRRGEKSGEWGWYQDDPNAQTEFGHLECVAPFHNLEGSDYPTFEEKVAERVRAEELESLREEALEEAIEKAPRICSECLDEKTPEELHDIRAEALAYS